MEENGRKRKPCVVSEGVGMHTGSSSWFPMVLEDLREFAKKNGMLQTASAVESAYQAFQFEQFELRSSSSRHAPSSQIEQSDCDLSHIIDLGHDGQRVVKLSDYKAFRSSAEIQLFLDE